MLYITQKELCTIEYIRAKHEEPRDDLPFPPSLALKQRRWVSPYSEAFSGVYRIVCFTLYGRGGGG